MSSALYQTRSYLPHPFMLGRFSVASLRRLRCRWLQCLAGYFASMCFCLLLSGVLHGSAHWKSTCYYERACEISNVFIRLCVCAHVCVWRGGERGGGGFIALLFYACDVMVWISLSPSVCACVRVCVWMNVDEKEKAALCIAVHHRQYPCFFSIHIHTPFSYPQQEQGGKKCKCFWIYSNGRFRSKGNSKKI